MQFANLIKCYKLHDVVTQIQLNTNKIKSLLSHHITEELHVHRVHQ